MGRCHPLIKAQGMERVLADIDAANCDLTLNFLRHGVLLVFGALCQLTCGQGRSTAGHIPLAELRNAKFKKICTAARQFFDPT
jgi:hypothetical protein